MSKLVLSQAKLLIRLPSKGLCNYPCYQNFSNKTTAYYVESMSCLLMLQLFLLLDLVAKVSNLASCLVWLYFCMPHNKDNSLSPLSTNKYLCSLPLNCLRLVSDIFLIASLLTSTLLDCYCSKLQFNIEILVHCAARMDSGCILKCHLQTLYQYNTTKEYYQEDYSFK